MAVKNFIPEIWSARLLENLDKNLVYGNAINRDYEGDIINFGDTVRINQMGDVTVKDYTKGAIDDPEDLDSTQTILKIDQAKYFNFKVEDIDAAQANVTLVDKGMARASYAIGDVIDTHVASFVKDATIKVGNKTTPVKVNVDNAYDKLVDLGVELDKKNVKRFERFVVLPPFYLGLLSKDPRFTKDFRILENGLVEGANVAGFNIYMSNNVPNTGGKFEVMAGTQAAISYAGQVSKIEAYRPEKAFSDAVKGLYVYGAKVVQPDALCAFTITEDAGEEAGK